MFDDPREVLLAPVISEKSYGLLDQNKYTFDVHPDANKTQIKIAVEKVFNVKVTDVNTLNRQGKRKRTRFGYGQRKSIKRAVVTLREAARIALLHYADGEKRYILAPRNLNQGDAIENGPGADIKPGNSLPLRNIPVGTTVHAIELRPGGGARIARSAGASVQLVAKDGPHAQLRLPSGEIRNVDLRCRATVGEVGNAEQSNINWGKAGRMRWKGKRPSVRGVAMNPIDHPHGGGEGKTSGGRHPVSPWGQPEGRTRRPKKASSKYIVRRRKTNKKR